MSYPDSPNPYAAPTADLAAAPVEGTADLAEVEALRRKYLGHEASVRSIGTLQYLVSVILVFAGVGLIIAAFAARPMRGPVDQAPLLGGIGAFYLVFGVFSWFVGRGLRKLQPWSRWTVVVITTLSLLYTAGITAYASAVGVGAGAGIAGFVMSALIPGYILYLLISSKGAMVFSPAYREVVAQTPHIKYKTSFLAKLILGLILGIIAIGIVGAILSSNR